MCQVEVDKGAQFKCLILEGAEGASLGPILTSVKTWDVRQTQLPLISVRGLGSKNTPCEKKDYLGNKPTKSLSFSQEVDLVVHFGYGRKAATWMSLPVEFGKG